MMVWSLFIIDLMGLFFYTKIGSIISIGDLPTTNIIEPKFKSSAVDVTTFLAPRILFEGLFLYLGGKKGAKLFKKSFSSLCPVH